MGPGVFSSFVGATADRWTRHGAPVGAPLPLPGPVCLRGDESLPRRHVARSVHRGHYGADPYASGA